MMPPLSKPLVIDAVLRAAGRAAAQVHVEMELGVDSLATIASVAPLLGVQMTLFGVYGSYVGTGEKTAIMAATLGNLAEAITRVVMGLGVGIVALWFYRYLRGELARLDLDMRNAILELANTLSLFVPAPPPPALPPTATAAPRTNTKPPEPTAPTAA